MVEDGGSLCRGSDGGGETAFSVNDYVETFMEAPEDSRSSTEYPDEVYTSSDDDDEEDWADRPILKVRILYGYCCCAVVYRYCQVGTWYLDN
jgi:hypothetical protein